MIVFLAVIVPNGQYNDAIALMNAGKFDDAISAFEALDGYRDSEVKIDECRTAMRDDKYNDAIALMDAGEYAQAISFFDMLNGYKDSDKRSTDATNAIRETKYLSAIEKFNSKKFEEAKYDSLTAACCL